jgi:hypothetical protein
MRGKWEKMEGLRLIFFPHLCWGHQFGLGYQENTYEVL